MELLRLCRIILPLLYLCCFVSCKPTSKEPQYGPEAGMEFMHGVLMHGDADAGEDHKNEDTYLRLQAVDGERAKQAEEGVGPCIGGDCTHELMHNAGDGVEHMEKKAAGVETENKESGPLDAMGSLHGVMMHGDEEAGKDHGKDHDKLANEAGNQDAPVVKDAMDEMHGVMMHGDDEQGQDHGKTDKEKSEKEAGQERPASNVESAHQFMHDDSDSNNVHNDAPRMDVGPRGVPSVGDPHEAIHGDLNVQLKLGENEDDEDKGKKGGKSDDDANFLGFSFPFISDSLMDEIELLKKTWLPKYWTSDEEPLGKVEAANSMLDTDTDILHDLAGVGDTGPTYEQDSHNHNVPEDKANPSPNHEHDES